MREKINQPKDTMTKSCEVDLVTEWDQKVEKLLVDGISSKFPDHKYVLQYLHLNIFLSLIYIFLSYTTYI